MITKGLLKSGQLSRGVAILVELVALPHILEVKKLKMLQSDRELLERIIEFPRNKKESCFAEILVRLDEHVLQQILDGVNHVSKDEISRYASSNFDKLDRRPNPIDNMLSEHELADAIELSNDIHEQTILTAMWLHFEEIRVACDDCLPEEAAFDTHLTRADVANYSN